MLLHALEPGGLTAQRHAAVPDDECCEPSLSRRGSGPRPSEGMHGKHDFAVQGHRQHRPAADRGLHACEAKCTEDIHPRLRGLVAGVLTAGWPEQLLLGCRKLALKDMTAGPLEDP